MGNKTTHDVAAQALQNIADGTPVEPAPFVMELMAAQHQEYQAVVNVHIEFLQGIVADRDAELAAIRNRMGALFASGFMPTESAISAALDPSLDRIKQFREGRADMERTA